eukprot:Seg3011.2 transcript_id=Seg3011.2/GoldUCD/mRNA.D3Y31 product="Heat shock factor protein" protein_id=Seg3011.2/GoldUCD/D3Y31
MEQDASFVSSNVPAFVLKLWKLVEDQSVNQLISWSKGGTAFCVHDPVTFSREVLPHYFKHNNFTSFVRQLNMYGFKKVVATDQGGIRPEKDEWEFHHQNFVQGKKEILELVKRKVHPEEKKGKSENVTNILEDVKELQTKHGMVKTSLEQLKLENEMLWQEVTDLRMKHSKQQHVLNKLIKFLILMYGGKRGVDTRKRLAIESAQSDSSKRRRSGQPAKIEELDNLQYIVESPKSAETIASSFDKGPQITVLPDEPTPQNILNQAPIIISPASTHTAQQSPKHPPILPNKGKTYMNTKGKAKKKLASSSKTNGNSLDLKMPTMVSLSTSKEPNTDFSPSIFENFGQIFPSDTNLDIGETLEELESSHNPSKLVVFDRQNSSPKEVIDTNVDDITNSLDSLHSLLSGPQFNIEPDMLSQLFHPEASINSEAIAGHAMIEDLQRTSDAQISMDGSSGSGETDVDSMAPFSPGMFLNDVGEASNDRLDKEPNLEEDSLL